MNNTPRQFKVITAPDITELTMCGLDGEGHCITCSDEAQLANVLRVDVDTGIAFVSINDASEEIDITLVEDVMPGSMLLVHGGVAIANITDNTDAANGGMQ